MVVVVSLACSGKEIHVFEFCGAPDSVRVCDCDFVYAIIAVQCCARVK